MRWSLVALGAPVLAGCSLIYNPSNLPDPRIIDAAVVDANPCALEVDRIVPAVIEEGQGDNGSAPALLVVHGNNLASTHLQVELKPKDGTTAVQLAPVTDALASGDTTYLAFTVTSHVDNALGKAGPVDVPLDVVITQDAPQSGACMGTTTQTLSNKLVLQALPELTAGPTTARLYSMIALPADMTFGAGSRVELNAVSSITLGKVTASANGPVAGPGGFPDSGDSGPGAGAVGQPSLVLGNGGGGGGGGFATAGANGANATGNGGPGGRPYGEDQILSYSGNRASAAGAGGGGVSALGGVPGGAGGGGGGMVILTAGGDIKTGMVIASGGDGVSASGGGGGGGGGAGGTVVVRTSYGTLSIPTVRVAGGNPGSPGGGAGSVGRVRWDAPGDNAPVSPDRAAHRGPAFKPAPRAVTMQEPSFTVVGTPGDTIAVRVIDDRDVPHSGPEVSFNAAGLATIVPMLSPGYNQVCAKLTGGSESEAAANTCISVAYLPPRR